MGSVSAINKTSIKVKFNKAVDEVAVSNFTIKVGDAAKTVDTAVLNADKTEATVTVQGLNYNDTVSVAVSGVKAGTETLADYSTTTKVPAVGDLYTLEITTEDADGIIKADGATKTMVTATLKDKQTGAVVNQDGLITFSSTKGAVAQPEVALEDGKASVQLTSAASDSSILSTITATVKDAPGATEYEGLTGQLQVVFSPDAGDDSTVTLVKVVSAESNQGDRLFVNFSGAINAANLKAKLVSDAAKLNPAVKTWADLVTIVGTNGGINIDGKAVNIVDILQKSDKTLEYVLNTDTAGSIKPTTTEINKESAGTWAGGSPHYLRDNVTHTVTVPSIIENYILQDITGINFIMTDAKTPSIYGVNAKDQLEFTVRASESLAEDIVEGASGAVNEKFLLDGKKVILNSNPTSAQIASAKAAGNVIVTRLSVGSYDVANAEDTRNLINFKLQPEFKLSGGVHQIQIANIGDWAAMVDPNNKVATQTFDFSVTVDDSKPTVDISTQSPEQWLLTFSKDVSIKTAGQTIGDVVKIYKADDSETPLVYGTDYIITPIDGDGNALAPSGTITTDTKYWLIEFTKDWTKYYDTAANTTNYFTSTKNPYKVVVKNFEDGLTNKVDDTNLNVTLNYDGVSPTISSAVDVSTLTNKTANGVGVTDSGQAVFVTMSEPVQLRDAGNTATKVSAPLTESQQQAAGAGIPVPTFEFVKGDKTVEGTIAASSIEEADKDFVVTPASTLEPGTWTLYIRSISDDIGNTSATVSTTVTVPQTQQAVTDTRIAWAGFDEGDRTNSDTSDYIYIKFTKEMQATDAIGVSRTTNYLFNGVALPQGSQVHRGIDGVTNNWDGITIEMPKGSFDPANAIFTSALNVANNFKAADGEALSGPYEVQLTDTTSTSYGVKDGLKDSNKLEAVYVNTNASAIVGDSFVTKSVAQDIDHNGKIDTVVLTFGESSVVPSTAELQVGGKTFVTAGGTGTTITFNNKTANDEIAGTATDALALTSTNGAIITAVDSIVDDAAPVVTKAELNSSKDKLTITMSEGVTGVNNGAFQALTTGDFTPSLSGGATIALATNGHISTDAAKLVFDVTSGANIVSTDTIAAKTTVYDKSRNTSQAPLADGISGANPGNTTAKAISGPVIAKASGVTLGSASEDTHGVPSTTGTAGEYKFSVTTKSTTAETKSITINDGTLNETVLVSLTDQTAGAEADTADEIRTALSNNYNIATKYTVGGTGADITLTQKSNTGDVTITASETATTAEISSSVSTEIPGVAASTGTKAKDKFTVSTGTVTAGYLVVSVSDGTITNRQVTVTGIAASDTAAQVAGKIANALNNDAQIGAVYNVTTSGDDVVLEQINATGDVTITVSLLP